MMYDGNAEDTALRFRVKNRLIELTEQNEYYCTLLCVSYILYIESKHRTVPITISKIETNMKNDTMCARTWVEMITDDRSKGG